MAEIAPDKFESELSKLKAAIDSEKSIIEIKFAELITACEERKWLLLERLDRIMLESEKQFRDSHTEYRKLIESRRILGDSLQGNENEDSLIQCFTRMDCEIAKKKPKWTPPYFDVAWNTQSLLASVENMCIIKTTEDRGYSRKTVSLTNIDTYLPERDMLELPMSAGWREHESVSADKIVLKSSVPEEKIPSILRWQKERPTLEREVVYADSKDGTFRLEWNGECFERSNIELSVGEHTGLLVLGDSNTSVNTNSFQVVSARRGVQLVTLRVREQGVAPEFTAKESEISSPEERTQTVRLVWKKQFPTLNTCVEYIDNRNDRIALQWNGDSFQSQPVLVGIGAHHGMLSLGDSDSLPLVEPFSVQTCAGVQEVLLDTPNKQ